MSLILVNADALHIPLADQSVHMCVCSPPYWGLRDYGIDGQLGLEQTPTEYVEKMVQVFREVWRVLRDDGTLWLNLGDSYNGSGGDHKEGGKNDAGFQYKNEDRQLSKGVQAKYAGGNLKPKDLCGIPWRVALALQADGWYLRSDIIWSKPNPMPESVQGSHYSRHRVTIEEYERLSRLREEKQRGNNDRAGDLSSMPTGEISNGQASLSEKREGTSNSEITRATSGCERETPTIRSVQSGDKKQCEISADTEGQSKSAETISELSNTPARSGGDDNGSTVARDIRTQRLPLLLLQEAKSQNDPGSRDTTEQGGEEYTGEYSTGLPQLQLEEEEQVDSSLLVDCPGCPKCKKTWGYIEHLSAGRPTKSHEYLFLLSKSPSYFYDSDAIREPHAEPERGKGESERNNWSVNGNRGSHETTRQYNPAGRNKRSVWNIATESYSGAHYATFPRKLVEPCIKAGTSERGVCPVCGKPWERVTEGESYWQERKQAGAGSGSIFVGHNTEHGKGMSHDLYSNHRSIGWRATCVHDAEPVPAVVFDPFVGSGTSLLVARALGRNAVGLDLSYPYLHDQARARLELDRLEEWQTGRGEEVTNYDNLPMFDGNGWNDV